jgi:hypothetical protein
MRPGESFWRTLDGQTRAVLVLVGLVFLCNVVAQLAQAEERGRWQMATGCESAAECRR